LVSHEHQKIVQGLIEHFKKKGFTIICAAYDDYDECPKKGRHEPDVIAKDSRGLHYIGEAETCDSLNGEDTGEQFQDFSNRQMIKDKQDVPFYIGIPKSCEDDLKTTLKNLNLWNKDNIHYVLF